MDYERLRRIAENTIEAESPQEIAFYAAYLAGVQGILLMSICLEVNPDSFDRDVLDHFIFGYCMGQKDLEDAFVGREINQPLH